MSALFVYLIKVNIALIIFCLGYYVVLRPLTFYVLNRVYLVSAILFATAYPLIDFEAILNRHQEIAQPVQIIILNWQAPVVEAVHDKWFWMALVFWTGVGILAIRFMMQLLSLYKLHRQSQPKQLHQYFIRAISGDINPFSFWKSIYINPDNHEPEELKAILAHEQVHVSEWHTIDILLGEISTIFYWFNPGVWLMKRAIRENIEFITDQKILQSGSDPKAYQYSLLNVSFNGGHNAIVNHFNTSTIKKRIMMMNTKRSSTLNLTRYALLVPAVVILVLIFSVSKAEFKKQVTKSNAAIAEAFTTVIEKMEPITINIAAAAKRSVGLLPDAVHVLFTDSVKKQTPERFLTFIPRDTALKRTFTFSLLDSTKSSFGKPINFMNLDSFGRIIVYRKPFTDTSRKLKEVTVTGYGLSSKDRLNSQSTSVVGDVMTSDGNIYFNEKPVNKAVVNGVVVSTHKMTPEEMEKLKQAGTATIGPGGVINISQQKVTKVKVNGVEMTSTSAPITNNSIQAQNIQNLSVDKDGVVHVSAQNLTYKDKDASINTQGITYSPNVINIKRADDSTKPLIVVNGNPVENTDYIPAENVKSISVFDGSPTLAKLYGDRAKNGVVGVSLKTSNSLKTTKPSTFNIITESGDKPVGVTKDNPDLTKAGMKKMYDGKGLVYYYNSKLWAKNSKGVLEPTKLGIETNYGATAGGVKVYNYALPGKITNSSPNIFSGKLLIVDGKEMTQSELSKIYIDKIDMVRRATVKELTKYGDKAKNGALIITTSK